MLKFIYLTLSVFLFFFIVWIFAHFTEMGDGEKKRLAKWYFGGLGSAGAACCTHPLDLIKVHLQTQQGGNMGAAGQAQHGFPIMLNQCSFCTYISVKHASSASNIILISRYSTLMRGINLSTRLFRT